MNMKSGFMNMGVPFGIDEVGHFHDFVKAILMHHDQIPIRFDRGCAYCYIELFLARFECL